MAPPVTPLNRLTGVASGYGRAMTDTPGRDNPGDDADPIDEEAAEIDARSPDAAEQIEELVEHAEELGRDTDVP